MYKITFKMKTPISFIDRPVFDSVVAYCHVKEKLGHVEQKLNLSKEDLKILDDLPLKKHEKGYYVASSMMFDEKLESVEFWCKRWNNQDDHLASFGKNKKQIDTQRGRFKSYQMPVTVNDIKKVWFYFDTDDKEKIQYLLLKHCSGIGKKISQGFGIFDNFEIEEIELNDFFTKIYRPIPISRLTEEQKKIGAQVAFTAWKPPYWLKSNMTTCVNVN